jgi:hypothetical protein
MRTLRTENISADVDKLARHAFSRIGLVGLRVTSVVDGKVSAASVVVAALVSSVAQAVAALAAAAVAPAAVAPARSERMV